MVYTDLELIQTSKIKFSKSGSTPPVDVISDISFGEIIHDGKLSWLATGSHLEVFSLKDGQRICSYHFDSHERFEKAIITSVTEIECANENCCFLAVGLQISDAVESIIAIYSVQGSKILRCITISDRITCCVHISEDITKRTFLQLMQGCLAIGTDIGKLILLDINFKKCEAALLEEREDKLDSVPCHMVKSTLDFTHISNHYKHTLQENYNFGIELEQVRGDSFVLSLLPVTPALCLIGGLEDGRMIIYDLTELQILYIVLPQEHLSPLSKMTFLQPQDDPRAMIYIWAFHENPESCFAVMHCLEYEKKVVDENDQIILFEEFQTSHVKLVLTMNEKDSLPIRCQAITKYPNKENDFDAISICMLAWKTKKFTQLLIFDMNQWYKEEMPEGGDWREHLTYLSPFRVKNLSTFDVYFDKNTVSYFNSVQRIEEHFYPISLTFDFIFLLSNVSISLHWPGLQYRALDALNMAGPLAILDPGPFYNEIRCASLMPQFCDIEKKKKEISTAFQREVLLSVALEYNCIGLLKNCARSWADGSCIGQKPNEGLSLSTLTDWIWKRAGVLKQRFNSICVCLFDYSGRLMDQRSKKELFHLTRQLKILADLLEIIITSCKQHIPNHIHERLDYELNSIRTASEYHDVLQWLLNIGLLPEGFPESSTESNQTANPFLVPYPYKMLNNYYKTQRLRFLEINHDLIKPRTNGCRLLYIDSFIEHKCNIESLKEHWQTELGHAVYPPSTMQALLRTLLVPDVPLETKHALLIYAFLDLNMAVVDESYSIIVQNLIKFPAVFKLNASLIKTVQAFWNLDHGQFEVALEEIICPFLHERKLEQWEQELLIESLLVQENSGLALRALQAKSAPVNSTLELKVYVANNLISEAFHLARSKNDPELLQTFVKCCEYVGKWNILRDLALTEEEEKIVEDLLKDLKNSRPENIYLMYMLQKSKYIEAKSFLDEIKMGTNTKPNSLATVGSDLELSKTLLSAYNSTMTPFSKNLNECYYNIRNKIAFSTQMKNKSTEKHLKPFSAELLKDNKKGLTDGLFQSSILSIDGASNYWNEKSASRNREERMMQTNNVPFVRKPQLEAYIEPFSNADLLSYPEAFKEPKKRRLDSDDSIISNGVVNEDTIQESRKKRIRLTELDSFGVFTEHDKKKILNEKTSKSEFNTTIGFSKDLLTTPMIQNCKFAAKERYKIERDEVLTPQSILKIKNLIKPNSSSILRPVTISNAKPIQHEYIESETVSEITESENELRETISHLQGLKSVKNSKAIESQQIAGEIEFLNSATDIVDTAEISEKNLSQPKASIISFRPYYKPKGRKAIGNSTSEYFSSVSLPDATKFFSLRDVNLSSYIKDVSTLSTKDLKDPEISFSAPDLSFAQNMPIKTSPKARRPLRKSETPPKTNDVIKAPKRVIHSEEMTDSDMLSRKTISGIAQKNAEYTNYNISTLPSRIPLSRLVTEKNLLKNISPTKEINSKKPKTIDTESCKFKEVIDYSSELYKTSTSEFNPLTCSSKLAETASKFIGNSNKTKLSDQTTVIGDISVTDTEIKLNPEVKSHCFGNIETDTFKSLMTTVEVTGGSWPDLTKNNNKGTESSKFEVKKMVESEELRQIQIKNNKKKSVKEFEAMESESEERNEADDEYKKEKSEKIKWSEMQYESDDMEEYERGKKTVEVEEVDKKERMKELLPKYERKSYNRQLNVVNSFKSQNTDVIDVSSESDNSTSSSNESESSSNNSSFDNSQDTSKESKSSNNYGTEVNSEEFISYDLMEKILRNATAKNIKKVIEKKQLDEITKENISDRPISVSSSLDSTLEISNEDLDMSKDDEMDAKTNTQMSETLEAAEKTGQQLDHIEGKIENMEQNNENNAGRCDIIISEYEDTRDIEKDKDTGDIEKDKPKTPDNKETNTNEKPSTYKNNHKTIMKIDSNAFLKSNTFETRAQSEQPNIVFHSNKTSAEQKNFSKSDQIMKDETVSKHVVNKHITRARSTEPIPSTNGGHWLRSSTNLIPDETKISQQVQMNANEFKKISSDISNNKVRAQSVDPEHFQENYFAHSPRPKRAVSEQPSNDSISKLQKIYTNPNSPNTIMTRRKSRLLDRIEEEHVSDTETKIYNLRKHHDLQDDESVSSFTLKTEHEESSPKTPKKSRPSSASSNLENSIHKTPVNKITRRASRGSSLGKDLFGVADEENTKTPTRSSRRLSMHKDTDSTIDNKEIYDSPMTRKRRSSTFVETPEILTTPRTTRASSSLREIVLTPRRSSRGASLIKELSPSVKEPEFENKEAKTPTRRSSRRLSHNDNTPKRLQIEELENISDTKSNQGDDTEIDTSVEKETNETEDYSMQRRLTRTQKNLLQKSANIKAIDQSMIPLKKRQSRMDVDENNEIESPSKNDDTISIKSSRSRKSTTSVRHSSRLTSKLKDDHANDDEDDNEDLESTVSSLKSATSNRTPKKRKPGKSKLNVISEKDEDNQKNVSDAESTSTINSSLRSHSRTKKNK